MISQKLDCKVKDLDAQMNTKWNDVMLLIGKIIEKQGDEGLNESAMNVFHDKLAL